MQRRPPRRWMYLKWRLATLDPRTWRQRRRKETAIFTLAEILDYLAERWSRAPVQPVLLTEQDYAQILRDIPADAARRGLKYVAPLCRWPDLLDFTQHTLPAPHQICCRPLNGRVGILSATFTVQDDQTLLIHFKPAPNEERGWWSQASGGWTRWSRTITVPYRFG